MIDCPWYIEGTDGYCAKVRGAGGRPTCFSPLAPVKGLGCPHYWTYKDRWEIGRISMEDIKEL